MDTLHSVYALGFLRWFATHSLLLCALYTNNLQGFARDACKWENKWSIQFH